MPKISTKLRELRHADVRFISLVHRSATRIPFRVLKRDEENMLDLTKIFKADARPEITAVVVRDSNDPKVVEGVKQALLTSGFKVDTVSKADNTLVYAQVAKQPEGVQLIRLSDDLVFAVKGFDGPLDGSYSETVAKDGFYSGVSVALGALQQKLDKSFVDNTDQKKLAAEITSFIDEFKGYTTALVTGLPLSAFKAEVAVIDCINKLDVPVKKADARESMGDIPCDTCGKKGCPGCKGSKKEAAAEAINHVTDKLGDVPCDNCGKKSCPGCAGSRKETASMAMDSVTKFELATVATKVDGTTLNGLSDLLAQAPKHIAENDWGKMSTVDKITWMKNWMEGNPPAAGPDYAGASKTAPNPGPGGSLADSQFTQPLLLGMKAEVKAELEAAHKAEIKTLTDLVQSIATKVDSAVTEVGKLTVKVGEVATKQDGQQKAIDEVAQKAETLNGKLSTTVVAAPRAEDTPAGTERSTKRASDGGDLRTGQFDTAFLPNRGRPVGARN